MNWLKRKIKEHNDKLNYVGYEEHWTVCGWICSLISLTVLGVMPLVILAIREQAPLVGVLGVGFGIFIVWWHFWHIIH